MVATRPAAAVLESPPKDDGLFGPGSITWRVHASPGLAVTGMASALYQMLHPRVMRMIDQASSFKTNPKLRGELTGEYTMTITFGDTEQAEKAGAALRYIHSMMKATDPQTGQQYGVDEPDLLMWVHCTLTRTALVVADRWGPALTAAEHDQYVTEQKQAARLVGIDPDTAPGTVAALDAYLQSMRPWMAFIIEAQWFRDMLVPTGLVPDLASLIQRWIAQAAVGVLPPDARDLYGFHYTRWQERWVNAFAGWVLRAAATKNPYDTSVTNLRNYVSAHAFGRKAQQLNEQRLAQLQERAAQARTQSKS
ncbi:MAG TPA: oxygenase MpaB family protein [bacterium]|jgi:uncharacterized protein (DUF2236 family)